MRQQVKVVPVNKQLRWYEQRPVRPNVAALARSSRRAAGARRQRPRRQRETRARRRAASFAAYAAAKGRSSRYAARKLRVRPRTLAHWRNQQQRSDLRSRPRGRPPKESRFHARLSVVELMRDTGPNVGLPTLRVAFPKMPRAELLDLQHDYRHKFQQGNRVLVGELTWNAPGRVWAMDHGKPPSPIDGAYDSVLAVRDLASGMQLAWLPVPDETAETTFDALQALFTEHGAPLVLKSDNGSAFRSGLVRALLDEWGVTPMRSPPVTPQYNGSCEAGIGGMKLRTHYEAALGGRSGYWTSEDVEAARRRANEFHHPNGHTQPTPLEVWQSRSPIDHNERRRFQSTVDRIRMRLRQALDMEHEEALTEAERATENRRVVRQALVERGLLSITWRFITLQIKSKKLAKIS